MERLAADTFEDRTESAWRLALALALGDAVAAETMLAAALSAPVHLEKLPADRLDRLVVLRSRELGRRAHLAAPQLATSQPCESATWRDRIAAMRKGHRRKRGEANQSQGEAPTVATADDDAATDANVARSLRALAALDEQQREAWLLLRVFRRNLRWTSRAMDCSTTAVARHVDAAEDMLRDALGAAASSAAATIAHWLDAVDASPVARVRSRARSRQRRQAAQRTVRIVVASAVILAAALGIVLVMLRTSSQTP